MVDIPLLQGVGEGVMTVLLTIPEELRCLPSIKQI